MKTTQLHTTSKNTHPIEHYISTSLILHFRCTGSERVSWTSGTELRAQVMIPHTSIQFEVDFDVHTTAPACVTPTIAVQVM